MTASDWISPLFGSVCAALPDLPRVFAVPVFVFPVLAFSGLLLFFSDPVVFFLALLLPAKPKAPYLNLRAKAHFCIIAQTESILQLEKEPGVRHSICLTARSSRKAYPGHHGYRPPDRPVPFPPHPFRQAPFPDPLQAFSYCASMPSMPHSLYGCARKRR